MYPGDGTLRRACALMGSHRGHADWPDSLAVAEDAGGYKATVYTASDFGCTQFKTQE